jgi:hypothetical protein
VVRTRKEKELIPIVRAPVWLEIKLLIPPVPVIFTAYVPGLAEVKLTRRVVLPPAVKVTDVTLNETVRPDGVEVEERAIGPAKLFGAVLPRLLIKTVRAWEFLVVKILVALGVSENPLT